MQIKRSFIKLLLSFLERFLNLHHYLRYKLYYNDFSIESERFFRGEGVKVYGGGFFSVGKGSYCGTNCGFATVKGFKILIGDNVSISHNVRVYTSNRIPYDIISGSADVKKDEADVLIGNNVWIGANVIVLQGVTIGNNVVIGANSVVSKSLQSNSIYAGAPIKMLSNLSE
ncbi:acyltransferase [Shewanella putrefaciens]|uniref:acyltransferase n=1 Tax=Shewanella putrefaciens TaxID=24 RepID=UPI0018E7E6F5|nr:acyltransferase [Shewanella putrefaciens]